VDRNCGLVSLCVCVCVCVCARARARVRVRGACMCARARVRVCARVCVRVRVHVFYTLMALLNVPLQWHFLYATGWFNPLNPELNPICYLLALLVAHHFLHVSRIRVKLLTFR